MASSGTVVAAPAAAAASKGKGKGKSHPRKLEGAELAGLLNEAAENMTAHKKTIEDLKKDRSDALARKRDLSKKIKKEKKQQGKKDRVMAKRSTWSLVSELERRMAAPASQGESAPNAS